MPSNCHTLTQKRVVKFVQSEEATNKSEKRILTYVNGTILIERLRNSREFRDLTGSYISTFTSVTTNQLTSLIKDVFHHDLPVGCIKHVNSLIVSCESKNEA